MSRGSRVLVDLIVVATLEGFVAEEVDLVVLDSGEGFFGFDVTEAVGFIPTCWEDVEGDLAAY